jgi:hypothetical protein
MTTTTANRRNLETLQEPQVLRILSRANVDLSGPIIDITDALYEWAVSHGADGDIAAEWAMSWDTAVAR